jgi:hypothetical protein
MLFLGVFMYFKGFLTFSSFKTSTFEKKAQGGACEILVFANYF